MKTKLYPSSAAALAGLVHDDQLIAVGGFGLCGIPEFLDRRPCATAERQEHHGHFSNNAGVDGFGLGQLLETRQIKKMISSRMSARTRSSSASIWPVSWSWSSIRRVPWPRSIRAGGAGIPAFFTRHRRRHPCRRRQGGARISMAADYVMETQPASPTSASSRPMEGRRAPAICVFRKTARNFNPADGDMAGKACVVPRLRSIVPVGDRWRSGQHSYCRASMCDRIIVNPSTPEKRIETAHSAHPGDLPDAPHPRRTCSPNAPPRSCRTASM
jgi:3-oxoacid CoA-transferase subunit A